MPLPDSARAQKPARMLPVVTWVGLAVTAAIAFVGAVSGGFWSMVTVIAVVVLGTALYGLVFHRRTWLRLPKKRSAAAIGMGIALAVLIGSTSALTARLIRRAPKRVQRRRRRLRPRRVARHIRRPVRRRRPPRL